MKKVFIIDDNTLSIQGLCQSIPWEELGAQVIGFASDPHTFLEQHLYDAEIIISDVCMPGFTEIELSRQVLALRPEVKIVLISAYDNFEYAKEAVRVRAFDYIEKPLDYQYVQKTIKRVIEQIEREEQLAEELENSRELRLERFFYTLLEYSSEDAAYHLNVEYEHLGFKNCSHYLCVVANIHNAVQLKETLDYKRYQVILANIAYDLQHVFSAFHICYCITRADRLQIILGFNDNTIQVHEKVVQEMTHLCENYLRRRIELRVGLGNTVDIIWKCSESYQNAQYALRLALNNAPVSDISFFTECSHFSAVLTDRTEEKLIGLLYQNDLGKIQLYLDQIKQMFLREQYAWGDRYIYLFSFLFRLSKFLHDVGSLRNNIEHEIAVTLQDSSRFYDIDVLFEWIYHLCVQICAELHNSLKNHHEDICNRVCHYIETHYSNSDLNLSEIAGTVFLSTTHLSALFKRMRNTTITDTIAKVRLDHASTLLRTTNLSAKTISEMTGYSNPFYFSANFKKKTGLAPSEYREQNQKTN